MTQRNFALPALLALSIAACQQPANDSTIAIDNSVNASEVANADIEALPPSETSATLNEANAAANAATPAKLPTEIPAQFHGRWGINRADCTSTMGDAKGLLTITDARLTFYESRGTLDKVLGATANGFDAAYGFTGEGQTWERIERLKLVGDALQRRTDAAAGQEPPVNLTYQRCGD